MADAISDAQAATRFRPGQSGHKEPARGVEDIAALKERFLQTFREVGSTTPYRACLRVGLTRTQVIRWRDADPEFAARYDDIVESLTDELVTVAEERGKSKSDLLLMFTVKARRNEYRDNHKVEISGPDGAPLGTITAEERAAILAEAARLAVEMAHESDDSTPADQR